LLFEFVQRFETSGNLLSEIVSCDFINAAAIDRQAPDGAGDGRSGA